MHCTGTAGSLSDSSVDPASTTSSGESGSSSSQDGSTSSSRLNGRTFVNTAVTIRELLLSRVQNKE